MPTDKEIWGVPVAVSLAGRTNWPNEIKVVAVRKVLGDGERLADIGREIGAHENLIRKWCNQERRARGETVSAQEPFASVQISNDPVATPPSERMCKLHIGDATLELLRRQPAKGQPQYSYTVDANTIRIALTFPFRPRRLKLTRPAHTRSPHIHPRYCQKATVEFS